MVQSTAFICSSSPDLIISLFIKYNLKIPVAPAKLVRCSNLWNLALSIFMEIPALFYFSFWSIISIASLKLGFIALERESSTISPLVIFLIKRFLAVCVCHSSTYALVHRFGANNTSLLNHFKLSTLGFSFLFFVWPLPLKFVLCYAFVFMASVSALAPTVETGLCLDFVVRSVVFSLEVRDDPLFPFFVLVAAFFTAGLAGIFEGFYSGSNWSDRETGPVEVYSTRRKIAQFIGTTLAAVAFQMSVKFESPSHVLAFLWFLVAGLGCTALTMGRFELGLFDRMVCSVLLSCTNRFGLSFGPTWLAFGVSTVLFVLHPKVKGRALCA